MSLALGKVPQPFWESPQKGAGGGRHLGESRTFAAQERFVLPVTLFKLIDPFVFVILRYRIILPSFDTRLW
jgi:hypothetical protein